MGIERTVTLWYLHRQILLHELALLEAQLVQVSSASEQESVQPDARAEVEKQCKRVQEMLRNLGPCPRPMMG